MIARVLPFIFPSLLVVSIPLFDRQSPGDRVVESSLKVQHEAFDIVQDRFAARLSLLRYYKLAFALMSGANRPSRNRDSRSFATSVSKTSF